MKVSLNKLRFAGEHFDVPNLVPHGPDGLDTLVQKIGAQLGAVEEVVDLSDRFEGVIIVKVMSCEKHPDADKLSLCRVDDGGAAKHVERGEDGLVQVVCGAPNVREGLLAAWLPPDAIVPSTRGAEPFKLEAREIRGKKSNGMLASPKELGIGEGHEGILEVDVEVKPGTGFAKAYRSDSEAVIDIENKMFTHRPDCFGLMGIAREVAGIQGLPFKSPAWYVPKPEFPKPEADGLPLKITNEIPKLTPRFTAITMSNITVGPSPVWLQIVLNELGVRPINNIVDYTNFWMLETGQPLHAYDYDKVKALSEGSGAHIIIRQPKKGETIKLLSGKTVEPRAEAIMIAADKQLIGIGGVMGGADTEVDTGTKNIILECANFDMYSIRRTSMTHGIFTDAVTRFTKGQSPLQNLAVLARIVEHIRDEAGGKVAGEVLDVNQVDKSALERDSLHPKISVTPEFINERLGLDLTGSVIRKLLQNVEFKIPNVGDDSKTASLEIIAPFWRTDVETAEDVVEEVGRLYGYDKLPLELPKRGLAPAPRDGLLDLKAAVRTRLARAGASEVLTYSFVPGDLLGKAGQDRAQAFEVANALSPDLQYYRVSLTPSLLEKVHPNIKAGHDEFALFELGKAHVLGEPDHFEPDVPKEVNSLSLVYASKAKPAGAPYYEARYLLTDLLRGFQVRFFRFEPLQGADLYKNPWLEQMVAPFEPGRSAVLRDYEGLVWGVVGEFKPSVRQAFKLPPNSAGFEFDPLLLQAGKSQPYAPLYRFPSVKQDITLKVSADQAYQELYDFFDKELAVSSGSSGLPASTRIEPVDIYQQAEDSKYKHVTFRVVATSDERTLTDKEVNAMLEAAATAAKARFKAERI